MKEVTNLITTLSKSIEVQVKEGNVDEITIELIKALAELVSANAM